MQENAGEIEKLKSAFDECIKAATEFYELKRSGEGSHYIAPAFTEGANITFDLLRPFVEFYLRTKANAKAGKYVDDMKIMPRFKKALGMPLMDWEKGMAQDE